MFRGKFLYYLDRAFSAGKLNFSVHHHLHEPAAFRRYLAPGPLRGTNRALIAQMSALPHGHHGGDWLHRAGEALPFGA